MGTDRLSREELASKAEQAAYSQFIRTLIFLPTVREIRESAATMLGLHPPTIERVILSLSEEWRSKGRTAEAELIEYVKELIHPLLPHLAPQASSITGTRSLMAFLLRAPNALRMRTALLAHRDLVNQDLLNAANAAPIALGRSPPGKELCPAMYLIPRVTDDRKEIVKGVLMWGSFCRAHLAMWNAERHFRRAKELAKGLADPGIHLMIISAQAGLCRDV